MPERFGHTSADKCVLFAGDAAPWLPNATHAAPGNDLALPVRPADHARLFLFPFHLSADAPKTGVLPHDSFLSRPRRMSKIRWRNAPRWTHSRRLARAQTYSSSSRTLLPCSTCLASANAAGKQ